MMRPVLKLVPLLVLYVVVVLLTMPDGFVGDEARYYGFAQNLLQGHYSPPEEINLASGPGYSLFLAPFVLMRLPVQALRMLNPLLLFGAVLCFHRALRLYISPGKSAGFAFLFGLYPLFIRDVRYLITESFVSLLVCALLLEYCLAARSGFKDWRHIVACGLLLGWLTLTKVLFGYLIVISLIILAVVWLVKRQLSAVRTGVALLIALAVCVPYLTYTYALTGKVFYWSAYGGAHIYWMSCAKYGDCYGSTYGELFEYEVPEPVMERHGPFLSTTAGMNQVERDEAFKAEAMKNIRESPKTYIANWFYNTSRMFFGFPYAYTEQKISTLGKTFPNAFLVTLGMLCVYPAIVGRRRIPVEVFYMLGIALMGIGAGTFVFAVTRYLEPFVPFVVFWILMTLTQAMKIEVLRGVGGGGGGDAAAG